MAAHRGRISRKALDTPWAATRSYALLRALPRLRYDTLVCGWVDTFSQLPESENGAGTREIATSRAEPESTNDRAVYQT